MSFDVDLIVNVLNNVITGAGPTGITAQNGVQLNFASGLIDSNTISGIAYTGAYWAASNILLWGADDVTINDNTVTGANISGEVGLFHLSGDNLVVSNNTFDSLGWGILLAGGDNALITGNDVTNSTLDQAGIFVYGGPTNTTITYNTITGNETGLFFWDSGATGNFTTATVNFNNISGNTTNLGVYKSDYSGPTDAGDGILNASGNWWGTDDPSAITGLLGAIDYTPILKNGDTDGGAVGFGADKSEVIVHLLGEQSGGVGRIQEGIDMVEGSTVYLTAGTFNEGPQIVINKDVNVIGAGVGNTIVVPTGDTTSSGDGRGWWLVNPGNEFNLSDLTLDGAGYQIWQGIRHKGSGDIDNVEFKNIGYNPSSSYAGTAVAAFGGLYGPPVTVNVTHSTFANIGRIGVQYFGAGTSGTFNHNVYTGKGVGDWLDYGVEVGAGAHAQIKNSTFTNNLGVADVDGSTSAGILVTTYYGNGSEADILYNEIHGNTTGVAVGFDRNDKSRVHMHFNDISGNDMNLVNTGKKKVHAQFNYWGFSNKNDVAATISGKAKYKPFFKTEAMLNLVLDWINSFTNDDEGEGEED